MRPHDPLLGRQLANYRLERLVGQGGMGRVYYGWDTRLDRPVAIKIIDARLQGDPNYARRFIQEARAIAAWEHPGIPQVYFADHQHGLYFYAMEYIQGADLERLIQTAQRRGERLPQRDVLHIARSVAETLDYAHRHGVIHRDVKPANILIAEDGRVVLTDFGLAMDVNLGTLGEVFGSPRYIAPEQARNSALAGPASDLYALGVILYQLLTGVLPFDDPSPAALAVQHLTAAPPPPRQVNPELSAEVERILLKTLEKDPAQRYASGQELMADLEVALRDLDPGATHLLPEAEAADPTPATQMHLTLTERVAEHRRTAPTYEKTQVIEDPQAAAPGSAPARRLPLWWIGGGCVVAALLCGLLAVAAFSRFKPAAIIGSAPGLTATWTPGTPLAGNASGIGNVGEPPRLPTQPPDETAVPLETVAPDETEIIISSGPPADTEAAGEGRFVLLYNQTSLYFVNRSGGDVPVSNFAFERLDKDGNPNRRVDGYYWGQIYASFRDGYCLVIRQFGDKRALEPEECTDRQLVVRTPVEEQDVIFWSKKEGTKEFRVLWREQEVARCPAGEGVCDVILP